MVSKSKTITHRYIGSGIKLVVNRSETDSGYINVKDAQIVKPICGDCISLTRDELKSLVKIISEYKKDFS